MDLHAASLELWRELRRRGGRGALAQLPRLLVVAARRPGGGRRPRRRHLRPLPGARGPRGDGLVAAQPGGGRLLRRRHRAGPRQGARGAGAGRRRRVQGRLGVGAQPARPGGAARAAHRRGDGAAQAQPRAAPRPRRPLADGERRRGAGGGGAGPRRRADARCGSTPAPRRCASRWARPCRRSRRGTGRPNAPRAAAMLGAEDYARFVREGAALPLDRLVAHALNGESE